MTLTKTDPSETSIHQELLRLIPADAKVVLELGSSQSKIASEYKKINPHCYYIGIESNPEIAKSSLGKVDKILVGNIAENISTFNISPKTVDCLIYNLKLTAIANPIETLKHTQTWLKKDAQVLAIIANVQHWRRIINLLKSDWENSEIIRHSFTLENIKSCFAQANLQIYEIQTRGEKGEEFEKFLQITKPLINSLGLDRKKFATQTRAEYFIIRATNTLIPPRRLLIQTIIMDPKVCGTIRVWEPDKLSATIPGVRTISTIKTADLNVSLPQEEKVFIWQRTILKYPSDLYQLKSLLKKNYLIVAEIDDNPLRRPEYAQNNYLSYRGCHCIQTSTESLAKLLQQYNPNVVVFQNQLTKIPTLSESIFSHNNNYLSIFFGAVNREADWQEIMPIINQTLLEYQDKIRIKVIHDKLFFETLNTPNKEYYPYCNYQQYLEILSSCHISLLPLNDNQTNQMKSDLKFLECAGHGVAVLASPTVYQKSIIDGETGLIYYSLLDFRRKIRQLIINKNLREKIATNAYNWVKNNRLLSQHYRQRRDWYLQMIDELPRLNQELKNRVPELFY
ncbi:methyltransferase domain-containing protein [Okeania sp.]|uniref:methyltransferase domain-containing protein n=1 Tax=Okeania sp. TaxID=3100323 RepID=UPI002B4ABAC5|nr:methyltransferase domain-containing protein [Okeania sp.]MEB3341369.1 methyltransferase domain-containing protein [Okeania sp.]